MQARPPQADAVQAVADGLLDPAYWLVIGLKWSGDTDMAETAIALAPPVIPRDSLAHDAHQVLGCADLYARKHAQRVVFFSDLTRMFTAAGTSWEQLGVDWLGALAELQGGRYPALYLTVSERAHLYICDPSADPVLAVPGEDATKPVGAERELVRHMIERQLAADWPPYIQDAIGAGHIRLAG